MCLERFEWVSLGAYLVDILFDADNALNKALRVVGVFERAEPSNTHNPQRFVQ